MSDISNKPIPLFLPGLENFPTIPSFIVALSAIVGVVGVAMLLFIVYFFLENFSKKSQKQKVTAMEPKIEYRDIEKLREEVVEVDHFKISEDTNLTNKYHAKPGRRPSIFSAGDILSEVSENYDVNENSSYLSIFSHGDFLMEVLENRGNVSNISIPDFSLIAKNLSNLYKTYGDAQNCTIEVCEDELGSPELDSIQLTPPIKSINRALFLKGKSPELEEDSASARGQKMGDVESATLRRIPASGVGGAVCECDCELCKETNSYVRDTEAVTDECGDHKTEEENVLPLDLFNKGNNCNSEVVWCNKDVLDIVEELLDIIDLVETEHSSEEESTSTDNVSPEPKSSETPSQVQLSVLPLPFQAVPSSCLEMTIFSPSRTYSDPPTPASHSSLHAGGPTLPSTPLFSHLAQYTAVYNSRQSSVSKLSTRKKAEYFEQMFLPFQAIPSSCLDMSILSPSLTYSDPPNPASHSSINTGGPTLPSTPLFSHLAQYTPVYNSRQASVGKLLNRKKAESRLNGTSNE